MSADRSTTETDQAADLTACGEVDGDAASDPIRRHVSTDLAARTPRFRKYAIGSERRERALEVVRVLRDRVAFGKLEMLSSGNSGIASFSSVVSNPDEMVEPGLCQ